MQPGNIWKGCRYCIHLQLKAPSNQHISSLSIAHVSVSSSLTLPLPFSLISFPPAEPCVLPLLSFSPPVEISTSRTQSSSSLYWSADSKSFFFSLHYSSVITTLLLLLLLPCATVDLYSPVSLLSAALPLSTPVMGTVLKQINTFYSILFFFKLFYLIM